jgi:DNA-binding ferritin-like protein (Dps family)
MAEVRFTLSDADLKRAQDIVGEDVAKWCVDTLRVEVQSREKDVAVLPKTFA